MKLVLASLVFFAFGMFESSSFAQEQPTHRVDRQMNWEIGAKQKPAAEMTAGTQVEAKKKRKKAPRP